MTVRAARAVRQNPAYRPEPNIVFANGGRACGLLPTARPPFAHHLRSLPVPQRRALLVSVSTLLSAAACASRPEPGSVPAPAPAPSPAPRTGDVARPGTTVAGVETRADRRPTATSWRFAWGTGARSYEVTVEAALEDAAREQERVVTRAIITSALETVGRGVAVRGTVDSLTVDASARVAGESAAPAWEPVRFTGTSDSRGVRIEAADPGAELRCATPIAAAVAMARAILPRVPAATLSVGTRWQDSSSVESCRSLVPTTTRTVHRYEVVSAEYTDDGAEVLRVRRRSSTAVRGQGLARGRPTSVVGAGEGEATLLLAPTDGRLVAIDGETRTTLTVTLPEGARSFTQVAREAVRERR